jgi:hypothetical protein
MGRDIFTFRGRGLLAIAGALALSGCATLQPTPTTGVQIGSHAGRLSVSIDGWPFTEYRYAGFPQPILYPIIGPTGHGVTRNFPMASPPGEEHDHPHHRSFWFGHGLVNGEDFWTERPGSGRIVHDRFLAVRGGEERGIIRTRNKWVAANGKVVCTDERSLTFYHTGTPERMFDFEITIHADHGEVVFGDTREGTMGVRVAETMRVMPASGGPDPESCIVNSEGARDQEAWGKRAKWCDYSGRVNGSIVGIAIFDHPKNPRHPTWWMVRDYGLFGANPFGQHEFERLSNEHVGDLRIPAGESVTFRYRIYIHTGKAADAQVAERYEEFAAEG